MKVEDLKCDWEVVKVIKASLLTLSISCNIQILVMEKKKKAQTLEEIGH